MPPAGHAKHGVRGTSEYVPSMHAAQYTACALPASGIGTVP